MESPLAKRGLATFTRRPTDDPDSRNATKRYLARIKGTSEPKATFKRPLPRAPRNLVINKTPIIITKAPEQDNTIDKFIVSGLRETSPDEYQFGQTYLDDMIKKHGMTAIQSIGVEAYKKFAEKTVGVGNGDAFLSDHSEVLIATVSGVVQGNNKNLVRINAKVISKDRRKELEFIHLYIMEFFSETGTLIPVGGMPASYMMEAEYVSYFDVGSKSIIDGNVVNAGGEHWVVSKN